MNKIGFNVFYVITKGVSIVTNLKRPIYQTLNSSNLMWKWFKTLNIYKMSCIGWFVICLKCEILIIDTLNEYIKKSDGMVSLFFCNEFNGRMPIIINLILECIISTTILHDNMEML